MKQIKSILYYVDESVDSTVVKRLVELAEAANATITLGSVVRPARSQVLLTRDTLDLEKVEQLLVEDRLRLLDEAAAQVRDNSVKVATRVFVGDPVATIIEAVKNDEFDFLVKVPTPAEGLRRQLFGGIDMRLMRACPCPVVIGPPKRDGLSGKTVAAVDYDEGDPLKAKLNSAILNAVTLLLGSDSGFVSETHIVHAWTLYGESLFTSGRRELPPEELNAALRHEEERRRKWLDELVSGFRATLGDTKAAQFQPIQTLLHGEPTEVIPRLIQELDADSLAMGTVSRSGVGGMLMGNTAEAILNRVNCAVLTLKPDGFAAS